MTRKRFLEIKVLKRNFIHLEGLGFRVNIVSHFQSLGLFTRRKGVTPPASFPCHRNLAYRAPCFFAYLSRSKDILPLLRDGICFSSCKSCYSEIWSFPPTRPLAMSMATLSLSWSQKNSSAPRVLRASVGPAPRLRVPEPSICFWNALGRAKCYKTGEKSIFGPLPGGRPVGGPPGPPATLRRRVGRPLSEGGASARAFWHHLGFQNPEYASPELRKCFLGLQKSRICFPWAAGMPLPSLNAEKTGEKRDLF